MNKDTELLFGACISDGLRVKGQRNEIIGVPTVTVTCMVQFGRRTAERSRVQTTHPSQPTRCVVTACNTLVMQHIEIQW